MPQQDLAAGASLFHAHDAAVSVGIDEHLRARAVHADARVEAPVFEAVEGVLGKVVVAGADIAVRQPAARAAEAVDVVADQIVGVFHQADAGDLRQIGELLVHIADHHGDVPDPGLLQLGDLPVDQAFALDLEQRLGQLQRERDAARRGPGGQNDRPLHAVGREGGHACRRDPPEGRVGITGLHQPAADLRLLQHAVESDVREHRRAAAGFVVETVQQREHLFGQWLIHSDDLMPWPGRTCPSAWRRPHRGGSSHRACRPEGAAPRAARAGVRAPSCRDFPRA